MGKSTRQGFAVAPMIVLGLVCMILAFSVAAAATYLLNQTQLSTRHDQAVYLAQGALAQTMSRLHDSVTPPVGASPTPTPYGRNNETVTFRPDPQNADWVGTVSFVSSSPGGWSTNNLDGHQGNGWNQAVPAGTALLVAQGQAGSTTATLEALVQVTPYKYVLASGGDVNSSGLLSVRAETSMANFVNNAQAGTPDSQPANVGLKGTLTSSSTQVTGDVVCASGNVNLGTPASVGGSVLQHPVSLPGIDITKYAITGPKTIVSAPPPGTVRLDQNTYAPSGLTVAGDLHVDSALLYVNGSLTVQGGLYGTGAVIVNGSVTIDGGASLDTDTDVALLARGDVTLSGTGTEYFQGLVYTEGTFKASSLTIAGDFISVDALDGMGSGSGMKLDNVNVVYIPDATNLSLSPYSTPDLLSAGSWFTPPTTPSTVWYPSQLSNYDTASTTCYQAIVSNPTITTDPSWPYLYDTNTTTHASQELWDATQGPIFVNMPSTLPLYHIADWNFSNTQGLWGLSVKAVGYNAATNRMVAITPPLITVTLEGAGQWNMTLAQFDAAAPGGVKSAVLIAGMEKAQTIFMATANHLLANGTTHSNSDPINLALNQFLSDQTPFQILSWRQLH